MSVKSIRNTKISGLFFAIRESRPQQTLCHRVYDKTKKSNDLPLRLIIPSRSSTSRTVERSIGKMLMNEFEHSKNNKTLKICRENRLYLVFIRCVSPKNVYREGWVSVTGTVTVYRENSRRTAKENKKKRLPIRVLI